MFGRCVFNIRAFSIIGFKRECVAQKYQRRKNERAAPTYRYVPSFRKAAA